MAEAVPQRRATALTFGRFPIITHGHLAYWRTILERWDTLVLGMLDVEEIRPYKPGVDVVSREFYDEIVRKCGPRRNPFTADERRRILRGGLEEAGLQERVRIDLCPIPELHPAVISERYPAADVDIVTGDLTDPFERMKIRELETILGRPIANVQSGFVLHTTDAKHRILGGDKWSTFVPAGAYEVFVEIGGPARLPADS
ncbi:hypothetical protein AB0368_30215 [Actinoplanes sp. NPDC051475]|uniref:hypothetical protein n=1 Tax=Actinoplanes sp. NPDC051475 TaxID=3157225 RepID=UPI003450EE13